MVVVVFWGEGRTEGGGDKEALFCRMRPTRVTSTTARPPATTQAKTPAVVSRRGPSVFPHEMVAHVSHNANETQRTREIRRQLEQVDMEYFGVPQQQPPSASTKDDRQRLVGAIASAQGDIDSRFAKGDTITGAPRPAWLTGPSNPEGRCLDASDRNLLCMDSLHDTVVVGSVDHGLKVYNARTGRELRTLFSKKFGHAEWVTSCSFLPDGRILSGGMDSKICLWHSTALRCEDLLGHTASVSQVAVNHLGIAVSSSYDRTLRVWDCNAGVQGKQLAVLSAHSQPVMQFVWFGGCILSGDRKGQVILWDLATGQAIAKMNTVAGQIGALGSCCTNEINLSLAGDQSGSLTGWDFRNSGTTPVFQHSLHPGGVLSGIKQMNGLSNLMVTCGADKRIVCSDYRNLSRPVAEFVEHKDFIYSLEVVDKLIVSGGGNGWVLVHDVEQGRCLYALGANKGAVRCLTARDDMLVAAGDDGKVMIYDM